MEAAFSSVNEGSWARTSGKSKQKNYASKMQKKKKRQEKRGGTNKDFSFSCFKFSLSLLFSFISFLFFGSSFLVSNILSFLWVICLFFSIFLSLSFSFSFSVSCSFSFCVSFSFPIPFCVPFPFLFLSHLKRSCCVYLDEWETNNVIVLLEDHKVCLTRTRWEKIPSRKKEEEYEKRTTRKYKKKKKIKTGEEKILSNRKTGKMKKKRKNEKKERKIIQLKPTWLNWLNYSSSLIKEYSYFPSGLKKKIKIRFFPSFRFCKHFPFFFLDNKYLFIYCLLSLCLFFFCLFFFFHLCLFSFICLSYFLLLYFTFLFFFFFFFFFT